MSTTAPEAGLTERDEPVDVKDVLVQVERAIGQLTAVLARHDPRDDEWNRLTEVSHALRRAALLLEGDARIG